MIDAETLRAAARFIDAINEALIADGLTLTLYSGCYLEDSEGKNTIGQLCIENGKVVLDVD